MIIAGFGFRTSATLDSLLDAYEKATASQAATALATLSEKADEHVFSDLADTLRLPVHRISKVDASEMVVPTNSVYSRAAYNTSSVAEATALAAAGTGAKLVQTRAISRDRLATCALAQVCVEGEID